jgi:hypothetical protein
MTRIERVLAVASAALFGAAVATELGWTVNLARLAGRASDHDLVDVGAAGDHDRG